MDLTRLTNSTGTLSKSGQPKFNCNFCGQIPGGFTVGDLTCHMVRIHNVGYKGAKEVKPCRLGCGKIFEAKNKNEKSSLCSDHASQTRQDFWLQTPDENDIFSWYSMFRRAADRKKLEEDPKEKALRVKAARKARDQAKREGKRSRSRSDEAGPSTVRRRLHSPAPAIDHANGHSAMHTNGVGGFEIQIGSDGLADRRLRRNLANGDVAMPAMDYGGLENMDLNFRPELTAPTAPTIYQAVGSNGVWMSFGGPDERMEYHDSGMFRFDADIDSDAMLPAYGIDAESASTLLEPLRQELAVEHDAAAAFDAPVASAGVEMGESLGEESALPDNFDDLFDFEAYHTGLYDGGVPVEAETEVVVVEEDESVPVTPPMEERVITLLDPEDAAAATLQPIVPNYAEDVAAVSLADEADWGSMLPTRSIAERLDEYCRTAGL